MTCCVNVVLPAPGPPTIRLTENSGSPPPRTSSSPATPVLRHLIRTFSGSAISFLSVLELGFGKIWPAAVNHPQSQIVSNESAEIVDEATNYGPDAFQHFRFVQVGRL